MVAVPVQAGDTLSQIASEHGISLSALEAANSQFSNPNMIYVGQNVVVPSGGSYTQWSPSSHSSSQSSGYSHSRSHYSPARTSSAGSATTSAAGGANGPSSSSSDITDIPGVPQSFVKCVAFRESTNGTNAAYDGGTYGIINASGYHVNGQSLSAQKQAFASIYHTTGPRAWAADHCPGT